ncbi:MAG TPA: ABC transporter substrate-binding protein [Stellaceae bacterium]|nr:ABC transporter substrate-binding protein [Stellaceae bacterium]
MRRREFLTLASAAATVAWRSGARAQEPGRVYRLGNLFSAPREAPHQVALRKQLWRASFIEGQNLWIDDDGYGLSADGFNRHADDLVKARVDVILAGGDAAVRAAQRATTEIPVLALTDDMVGQGFVHSLARPDGNITGVTILAAELDEKRQSILIEAVPNARRIALLADSEISKPEHLQALQDAAHNQGMEVSLHLVARPNEIAPAIDAALAVGAKALNILASALFFNNRSIIFERVAAQRLPAIYQWPEMAAQGGFMGYGPSIVQLYRDVQSRQLLQLLRGTKPADLPVEQPTTFELVINLKAAKALGLNVPSVLLAQADGVIE